MKLCSHTLICRSVVTLLIIAMLTALVSCGKTPAETATSIPQTTTMDSTPEETTAPIPPRGSTAIVDTLFEGKTSTDVPFVQDEEIKFRNFVDFSFIPLSAYTWFSELAEYKILTGDDDTVHTFAVGISVSTPFSESDPLVPPYWDYLYKGKTLIEWGEDKARAFQIASDYGFDLKMEGKSREEIYSNPEFIQLWNVAHETARTYLHGYTEWQYKKNMENYQNALDFFKSFGFEEFHDITDSEWQIKLSEAVSGSHFAVSGTAENIKRLIEENTQYGISLVCVDDDGIILGNVEQYENEKKQYWWTLLPYWMEQKLEKRKER